MGKGKIHLFVNKDYQNHEKTEGELAREGGGGRDASKLIALPTNRQETEGWEDTDHHHNRRYEKGLKKKERREILSYAARRGFQEMNSIDEGS